MQLPLPLDQAGEPAVGPPPVVGPRAEHGGVEPLFVRHPRAKKYVIRVRADGTIRVTVPRWGSTREARAFVERERRWIESERRRRAQQRAAGMADEERRTWQARATEVLPARLRELAASLGLDVARVSIRNQRWRWGSCSPNGHICLNWRLVLMPGFVRDYVIIHELMHLRRMDHSPAFWRLVAEACPDHEDARAWLRARGGVEG